MEVTCYLVVSRCIVSGILNVTEVCRSSLLIEAQRFFVSFEMAPSGRDGLNGSLCKWSWGSGFGDVALEKMYCFMGRMC